MDAGFVGLGTMGRAMAANLLPRSAIHVNMATTVTPVRATSAKSAKPHSSPPKAAGSFFGDFRTLASVLAWKRRVGPPAVPSAAGPALLGESEA
jgi:6-phosphogluconate dehydrogenase-like protein